MIAKHFLAVCLIGLAPTVGDAADLFQLQQQLDYSGTNNDVATGDLDQDGDPDIVVAANGVTIFMNTAPGQYAKPKRLPLNNDTVNKVGLADLDLDGDLDLIAARNGSPVEIFWNEGGGEFNAESYIFSGEHSAPIAMFVVDINHDGAADIIIQNINATPRVFLNDGHGSFPASSQVLLESRNENKIKVADINRDGKLDIVSYDDDGFIQFHWANATDHIAYKTSSEIRSENLLHFVVGDINRDGREDLLLIEFESIHLLINSQSGDMLLKPLSLGVVPREISAVTLADTNNDGYDDLILSLRRQKNLLYINNRKENFLPAEVSLGGKDEFVTQINVLDFDGDRDNDILFLSRRLNLFENTKVVSKNSESRQKLTKHKVSFAEQVLIKKQERIKRFELADFNGDDLADLVTLTTSGHSPVLNFFLNAGETGLVSHGSLTGDAKSELTEIAFADTDSDGDLDLLIGWLEGDVSLHRNDGQGTFDAVGSELFESDIRVRSLVTGFVNNDHHLDVVATGDRRTVIYFGTAHGRFITDYIGDLPTDAGYDAALADLDGDGDQDLVISSRAILIYYNRGNGSFTMPGTRLFNPNKYARQIFVFDIDGDGDLDLLTGGGGTHSFINEGDGQFAGASKIATLRTIALGDLEQDGDIDIVSYHEGTNSAALTNNGKGGWVPVRVVDSLGATVGGKTRTLRLGDFDGDGDPDIVSTGYNSNNLWLFENLRLGRATAQASPDASPQSDASIDATPTVKTSTHPPSGSAGAKTLLDFPWRTVLISIALLSLLLWGLRFLTRRSF